MATLSTTVLTSSSSTAGYNRAYIVRLSCSGGDQLPITVNWSLHVTSEPDPRAWYQCENMNLNIAGQTVYTGTQVNMICSESAPNRAWFEANGGRATIASGSLSVSSASFNVSFTGGFYVHSDTSCRIGSTISVGGLYTPPIPNLDIGFESPSVNKLIVKKTGSKTTDLRSYRYTINFYTDSGRTKLAKTMTGTNLNDFPITWNEAIPGTTYYYKLDFNGVNSVKGSTVSMSTKYGTTTTMRPYVNKTTFEYSASPLFNNHWTPRTQVSYTIGPSSDSESAEGLTFKEFEIQTAINSLTSNTKSHRVSQLTGTMTLVDLSKWLRECKPRDLVYIKVRVCHQDNAGREYFSDWFGMTDKGQFIYNKFHVYLTTYNENEELRINSRSQFSGNSEEKYWNKGEVM